MLHHLEIDRLKHKTSFELLTSRISVPVSYVQWIQKAILGILRQYQKPLTEECREMQRDPKDKLLRLTKIDLAERRPPRMADRRLRMR